MFFAEKILPNMSSSMHTHVFKTANERNFEVVFLLQPYNSQLYLIDLLYQLSMKFDMV